MYVAWRGKGPVGTGVRWCSKGSYGMGLSSRCSQLLSSAVRRVCVRVRVHVCVRARSVSERPVQHALR